MFINNKLRDQVYKNNVLHGFWDNNRSYEEFVQNLMGEFEEAMTELQQHLPTEVYSKDGIKPEGAPTELADIIIFILDYFGGSNPQVDIDETFLETPDQYYKNPEWYALKRQEEPWQYFIVIRDAAMQHIALSIHDYFKCGNQEFIGDDGKIHSTPRELHQVIKLILEFCDIYGIDMEHELIAKIVFNNSRPRNYRKIGTEGLLVTYEEKVANEALDFGYGMYKQVYNIIADRQAINEEILRKQTQKQEFENE